MRLTVIIMTVFLMQVSASGLAQRLTLNRSKIAISEVFSEIKKQTGYRVIWPSNLFDAEKQIIVSFRNAPLNEVMEKVLENNAFTYELVNKTVVLKRKESSVLDKIIGIFENVDVDGRIVDAEGKGLARVTLKVINGLGSTTTNDQGYFSLFRISENAVITVSSIGYSPITLQIINRSFVVKAPFIQNGKGSKSNKAPETEKSQLLNGTLNDVSIRLARETSQLEEVVVNKGYYTTTKKLNTGNTVTVTAADIEKQPVANLLQALQGRVPGLIINQNNGVPGSNFTVQIRGQNSILNGNTPLYVVDGVPYPADKLNQLISGYDGSGNNSQAGSAAGIGGLSPLNSINPADLESIDILKDADATAIYGSRGANGVILITTKKAKAGPMRLSANLNSGMSQITRMPKFMNTEQYLEMRNEAFANDKVQPGVSDYDMNGTWDKNKYTDWTKELVGKPSYMTNAQISLTGGAPQTQYLVSADYSVQNPPYGGNFSDKRGSIHLNLNNVSLNNKFRMNLSATYGVDLNNLPGLDLAGNLYLAPNVPDMLNPDGSLIWTDNVRNPYASLLQSYNGNTKNLMSNLLLSYQLTSGLQIRASVGYTNAMFNENRTNPVSSFMPNAFSSAQGNSSFGNNNTNSWIFEPQAEYKREIFGGSLTALAGATIQGNETEGQTINGTFISDAFLGNINAATTKTINNNYSKYHYGAIFSRLSYNLENKYLINLTGRRDGSSRFGPNKQFANFGAIGAGWIFSEEGLLKRSLPFLSFGKFRGSYGITGSDQIGDYRYLDSYTATSSYTYQGLNGLSPTRLFNPDFMWESNRKLEGAIELGFLKDQILISGSWFKNRSSNQLVQTPLAPTTGNTLVQENLDAIVQNTGWEWQLNTINIKNNNFNWKTSFNITFSRNKLIAFPGLATSSYSNNYIVGEPVSIVKLYNYSGVNPTTGLYEYITAAGTAASSSLKQIDQNVILNVLPKYYGGMQNSFEYKGFQVDVFFQFVKQLGRNLVTGLPGGYPGQMFNVPTLFLDRWQKAGDTPLIQKYASRFGSVSSAYNFAGSSTMAYSDASYLRCKNVALSYNFNSKALKYLSIKSARVYMQAQNLFTITNYLGADPETQGLVLPPLKTITAGIQFSL